MSNTILELFEQHSHGEQQQALEVRNILTLFPGLYDRYVSGLQQFGEGVVIYTPDTRQTAGYMAAGSFPDEDGMMELMAMLRERAPDMNHVPVVFLYQCGCVSGYVMTAQIAWPPGTAEDMAQVTAAIYGHLTTIGSPRFVGEDDVSQPWDIEL